MICEECGRSFVVKRARPRRFCASPCWYRFASRERAGKAPVAALVSKAAAAKRDARATLRGTFGRFTPRERAIFYAAYTLGYRRGYARGRSSVQAGKAAA